MHGSHFELSQRPFVSVPRAERYFPGAIIEEARTRLIRCIERVEGPALLIGAAGLGKSLLCQVLADHFQSKLAIVHLAGARLCSRRALLQVMLFELGLPYRDLEEGELRLALIDRLTSPTDHRPAMLLLVDEAHNMPFALLEEMRMITNLVRNGQPQVHLVLAGLPALEERFANPKLECFNQRLAARCYLGALNRTETMQYVRAQIAASQVDPDELLTPDALEAVYHATDGVPRLINQLCDQAILSASEAGSARLDGTAIETAWAELQQLPTPWCGAAPNAPATEEGVIEFGCLDSLPCDDEGDRGGTLQTEDAAEPEEAETENPADNLNDAAEPLVLDDQRVVALSAVRDDALSAVRDDAADSEAAIEYVPAGTIGCEPTAAHAGLTVLDLTTEPARLDEDPAGWEEPAGMRDDVFTAADSLAERHDAYEADDARDTMNYNPFAESYDEEEVVIDQFSALACDVFRQQQRVVSRGDNMPLHLLSQAVAADQRPSLSLAAETIGTDAPLDEAIDSSPTAPPCRGELDATIIARQDRTTPDCEEFIACQQDDVPGDVTSVIDLIATPAAALVTVDTTSVADQADPPAPSGEVDKVRLLEDGEMSDGDVILIDDQDDESVGDCPATPVTPVRAGQYAQLFSRLRRA